MGRRGSGEAMGLAERASRLRHRVELLAAILVLLSVPVLWTLFQQTGPTSVHPVMRPVIKTRALPQAPEAAQAPRGQAPRGQAVEEERERPSTRGCDDPRILVDRAHALPADYAPKDLVSLPGLGVPILGQDALLRREAAGNLERLVASAAAAGEELTVASAYRSYADQRASYARLVSIYGRSADKTSAPPGHSQHQLGTAVDFTNAAVGYQVKRRFGRTTAARWLTLHAHEHGFVLSYPPGKETETGFGWEPWHYRYVGAENARRIRESKLGLQGFLLREGILPRC